MHTPKVGDKFNLLGIEWEITSYENSDFFHCVSHVISLDIRIPDRNFLDWIEKPVTLSKAQAEAVKHVINAIVLVNVGEYVACLREDLCEEIDKLVKE